MANDAVRSVDLPRTSLVYELLGNAELDADKKTVRISIQDVASAIIRVLGGSTDWVPYSDIISASDALPSEAVASAMIYSRETIPIIAAGRSLIGGFEAVASYLVNENGYEFDLSTMPFGVPIDITVRATPGYSTVIQLGVGQFFVGYGTTSNKLTVGYGRSVRIMRLSSALFRIEADDLPEDRRYFISGTSNYAMRRPDGRWIYWHSQSVNAAADTDINLPGNFANLNAADTIITAHIGVETTNVGAYVLTVEKLTDTSYRVHNPNTSTQVGSNTQAIIRIDGLTYSAIDYGTIVVSASNPPARARMFAGVGQSNIAKPMQGQGPAAFESRLRELGRTPDSYWLNAAASGSSVLNGVATIANNYWWDQNTNSAGPLTTAAIASILAAVAAGQPAPQYLTILQGEEEARFYGQSGYGYVTAAAYISAWQNVLTAIRTGTSLPTLKALVLTLGGRSNNATDVGINVIRMAQIALCDNVNFFWGCDTYDAALRDDGIHFNMSGQKTVWRRLANRWDNLANGASNALGPTVSGFAKVDSTNFDITFSVSNGSLSRPAAPAGFGLLPTNDPAGTPLAIAAMAWQSSTVLRITLASAPGSNPWLSFPYGGAATPHSQIIYDSSGAPVRSAAMIQAT